MVKKKKFSRRIILDKYDDEVVLAAHYRESNGVEIIEFCDRTYIYLSKDEMNELCQWWMSRPKK